MLFAWKTAFFAQADTPLFLRFFLVVWLRGILAIGLWLINDGTLFSGLEPLEDEPVPIAIGTDASQVSHTVPLITLSAATMCKGTPLHHWAAAKQAGMTIGQKGMLYVARCMAEGTKLLMETPGSIEKAWELHKLTP